MKVLRTWVLIADAGRARVLSSAGEGLREVSEMRFENELPPTHELVDDRQPRSFNSVGAARHAITGGVDPRRKEKQRFMVQIAEAIEKAHAAKTFDRLVVVAPPQALGDLRDALSDPVKSVTAKEVALDLTKTPDGEVEKHLGLPFAL
jgi:protein required for attachment to host cells